jgi:hypothetical protein
LTLDSILSPNWLNTQIARYLAKPLSFPKLPNVKFPDISIFNLPPQKEQKKPIADDHLASRINFSSHKYHNPDGSE